MTRVIRTALLLCITLLFVTQALAADGGSYAVAPFVVNGPASFSYLEKAVPSMLSSRLYRKGQFEPVPDTAVLGLGKVSNSSSARQALQKTGAGYMVWGDVTVIGQDALINAHVTDKSGKEWNRQSKTQVNNMIASLQGVADGLTTELFGAGAVQAAAASSSGPLNPNMVQNQPNSGQVYLNPQIRYQGMDGARLRTQHLPFLARGMAVGDFNGDGKNEIALLDKNRLYMYRWTDRMEKIAEYSFSKMQLALTVKTIDLNRDGVPELVVSSVGIEASSSVTIRDSGGASLFTRAEDAYSYILSFKGNRFTEIASRLPFYLSVVRMPPDYRPVLVGQKGDSHSIFSRNGAYEVEKENGRYVLSRRLNLPKGVNIFSFTWLPGDGKNPPVMASITNHEKLCVRGEDGKELYTSQDMYSGSSADIEESTSLPGFGKSNEVIPDVYYVPMRMIAADFDKNRQWELLVNKPISAAAQFFSSYRDFPECEIHALTWDGVGTNLLWKTRRIKGTVTDFAVSDPNNDGVTDLVVCLNTHTGVLGTTASKTVLVAYPLDFSKTNPNTPAVISE
ncbi:MAG: VCBS repeat-containing protein [Desulfovibrionaceae bacterium]|nr:VCBS repeat-containing protein [Desulfovibrionaceae bacterium]